MKENAINPLGAEYPVFTPEAQAIRSDVDDLFARSDKVVHSILSAMHAYSKGIEYVKDETSGLWRDPTSDEGKRIQMATEQAALEAGVLAGQGLVELDESSIPTDLVDPAEIPAVTAA